MRISDIVTESWPGLEVSTTLTLDDFLKIFRNKSHPHNIFVTNALFQKGRQIYRGFDPDDSKHIRFININKTPVRQSANTSNYYTWWIDGISKKWADFPNRSNSFICSTDKYSAEGYGTSHLMIPVNTTIVGECPSHDFWESFRMNNPSDINDLILRIFNYFKLSPNDVESFKNALSIVTKPGAITAENIHQFFPSKEKMIYYEEPLSLLKDNNYNLIRLLDSVYDPKVYGFKSKTWPTAALTPAREVWFSADCYAVPMYLLDNVRWNN